MTEMIPFDHHCSWENGYPDNPVVCNPKMEHVYEIINTIKEYDTNVFIQGESGTGKSMIARKIQKMSPRASCPFIEVNCGSLNDQLLESELFGHVRGAFTGAVKSREGKLEAANCGTLFLDDIASASMAMQTKLLHVMENRSIQRVGENITVNLDCRFICASNRNIEIEVKEGRFREDLYYRIAVINIELPPLRARPEEIVPLINYYINIFNQKYGKKMKGLANKDRKRALNYTWPGNVRELKNAIERSYVLSKRDWVQLNIFNRNEFVESDSFFLHDDRSLKQAVLEYEKKYIESVLNDLNWEYDKAAKKMKIGRSTLFNKIKRYSLTKMV